MSKPRVSVIIPVIRPVRALDAILSVHVNAGIPEDRLEVLAVYDRHRIGAPRMVADLTRRAAHDHVLFMGDDCIMEPGCVRNALDAMATLPDGWGLVGLNDGIQTTGAVAAHWLAHKNLLHHLDGEFFCTEYRHNWCDVELTERCRAMGRYVFAPDARLIHLHPVLDPKYDDEDYRRVRSTRWRAQDLLTYRRRKRHGWNAG